MHSNPKPIIAIFTPNYLERSETFIYRQLLGIKNEFNPIVLTNRIYNLDLFPFTKIFSIPTNILDRIYSKTLRTLTSNFTTISPKQCWFWKKILKQNRVQLIHAHFGPAGLNILPVARSLNIPLVVTFHGYDASALLKNSKYLHSLRELFEYAHIIAVSKTMAETLMALGADPAKIFIHYIGVPLNIFKYQQRIPLAQKVRNNETINFLQVSRFVEQKGHKYTLKAFTNFLKYYPNSKLIFAGAGELEQESKLYCKNHQLNNNVSFLGAVDTKKTAHLMQQADIFLQHSVTTTNNNQEGIPIAIAEAMATGLPIISTYHAGIPELVRHGIDGFLVEERDIDNYVNKMQQMLTFEEKDTQNWLRQKFDLEVNCKKLCAIYWHIINSAK